MDKQTIMRDLSHHTGSNFATFNQIKKFMGMGTEKTAELVKGLEYFRDGKSHRYACRDVAGAIMSKVENH